jgi:ketosteroid isomerase-like protein
VSRENIEIVRKAYEAGSHGHVAGFLDLLDPECEWWEREDDPDASMRRGPDAIAARLAELDEIAEIRPEPTHFIDEGDFVVVSVRVVGRGQDSGASFQQEEVHLFKLRDGKIIEIREYREKGEALKAIGLTE